MQLKQQIHKLLAFFKEKLYTFNSSHNNSHILVLDGDIHPALNPKKRERYKLPFYIRWLRLLEYASNFLVGHLEAVNSCELVKPTIDHNDIGRDINFLVIFNTKIRYHY